jgi:hypothetical protein
MAACFPVGEYERHESSPLWSQWEMGKIWMEANEWLWLELAALQDK